MTPLLNIRTGCLAAAFAAAMTVTACVTYPDAAPVPLGDGTYSIGSSGRADDSYQGAIRFCFEQGRQLLRVNGQAGGVPPAVGEIRFRCVGRGEPGWKEPVG